jgi:hypothetical protein
MKRAALPFVVVALALAGACVSKTDKTQRADTGTGSTTKPPDPAEAGLAGAPGDNPQTQAYLHSVHFDPANAAGIIDQDVECEKNHQDHPSHLRVVPSHYSHKVVWANAQNGGNGHFVAQITVSAGNCENLHLNAGETGYLWIGPGAGGARTARVYKQLGNDGIDPNDPAETTSIAFCNYANQGRPESHLWNPPKCTDPNPGPTPPVHPAPDESKNPVRIKIHDSGLWVSCSSGCCQVQFT